MGSETVWVDISTSESVLLSDIETMMEAKNLKIRTITENQQVFALNPNKDEKVPPYKINHMKELQSLAEKFVRNVEEEMLEEPANVIFGDNISTTRVPKISKKTRNTSFRQATREA